jgi:hypothetical protein
MKYSHSKELWLCFIKLLPLKGYDLFVLLVKAKIYVVLIFQKPTHPGTIMILMWSCPGNMPKCYPGLVTLGNILAYYLARAKSMNEITVALSFSNTHTIYKKKSQNFQKISNFQESYVIKQLLHLNQCIGLGFFLYMLCSIVTNI